MARNFILLIIALTAAMASSAQERLVKLTGSLENNSYVKNTVYVERRDPDTRQLTESVLQLGFSKHSIAENIIKTFRQERENAVRYVVNDSPSDAVYLIEFNDGKGNLSSYILTRNQFGQWELTVRCIYAKKAKKSGRTATLSPITPGFTGNSLVYIYTD